MDTPFESTASVDNSRSAGDSPAPAANSPSPAITLPKGGGAIRGIGEKFGVNPVNGTGNLSIPVYTSPGHSDFYPQLSLSYDSGSGNSPFGFGWQLSAPHITRRTDKGLPRYFDEEESDTFILSGSEDLVPQLAFDGQNWNRVVSPIAIAGSSGFTVHAYRPRVEGLFALIERWVDNSTGTCFWRSISKNNVTSLYGLDPLSRIADPENPLKVFTWLLSGSYDDRGNGIVYEYKAEDTSNVPSSVAEQHRRITANRYIKRIHYGNPQPFTPTPSPSLPTDFTGWYFETVFDYGDQDPTNLTTTETQLWNCRPDAFSSYRSCFELRTYRLCARILQFHHIPTQGSTPGYQGLVRSTGLQYSVTTQPANPLNPIYAYLQSITPIGYALNGANTYDMATMPSLNFEYTQAIVDETIRLVDPASLDNLPAGVDDSRYRWTDLDSEGSPGILTEQGKAWYYKRNVSNLPDTAGAIRARFEPDERVADIPSQANLRGGDQQLMDLAGDGQLCLVRFAGPIPGFYEREPNRHWAPFRPFAFSPNIDWKNPNLRMLDLDGDGFADVLITENEVFTWYPSYAKAGFGAAQTVRKPFDEDRGPALIFADGTQSIYVSDMSGDGLRDLVRIRNGEVCYWPNLGYGRFGAMITMDASPLFDTPDQFNQQRIRLADIDGSGTTDIIYLGRDKIRFWYNQSGNSWSPSHSLPQFPATDDLGSVTVVDLLGNGTACLVWSSPLPGDTARPMRYIDLMGGQKPHLLTNITNNMGAETRIRYVASTRFYLADRLAGRPWATRLSFPVHVVARVETDDWVSRNRFVTLYSYHHGYFDGFEREFRGFGMVEQQDTEELGVLTASNLPTASNPPTASNLDAASWVPPVLTRTWFHTGAYPMGGLVSRVYASEYYRESNVLPGSTGITEAESSAMILPDTVLPAGLTGPEIREAIRSLKGSMLRQEIYALDGTPEAARPYSVTENNFSIEMLQPFGGNLYAVFFTHARESIDFQYERKLYNVGGLQLADPRVTHTMVLAFDDYGNETESVAIGYSRRRIPPATLLTPSQQACQQAIHVTYTEKSYTGAIATAAAAAGAWRTPMPAETLQYELVHINPAGNLPNITNLFGFDEMTGYVNQASDGNHDIPYEDIYATKATNAGQVYRRLIADTRTYYEKDDLSAFLPLGTMDTKGLVYQTFKQAFTSGLLSGIFQRTQPNLPVQDLLSYPAAISAADGGYVDLDGNGNWWIPSGQTIYSPLFYLPQAFQDPFGQTTRLAYDGFNLLLASTTDAAGNTITALNDYRVLQPQCITDPNGNRTQVVFDALGLVVATAVMGKLTDNPAFGDSIPSPFTATPTQAVIDAFFSDPIGQAANLLGTATTRIIYDIGRFARLSTTPGTIHPVYAATIQRETHVSDLGTLPASQQRVTKLQISFSYSDGFGREIQRKAQAEPGPVTNGGPTVNPRWIGSGWTIFNNKGKPVRQYEPFFSDDFDFDYGLTVGVSPILIYDPVGRVVATIQPGQSWTKTVFDPWLQQTWDRNDTVAIPTLLAPDPALDTDVGAYFSRIPRGDYFPTWYAQQVASASADDQDAAAKTSVHANTPTLAWFDSLGRSFLTIADNGILNGTALKYPTFTELDIQSFQRSVTDALGRKVMLADYDMLGTPIHQSSVDAGDRWMLNDVLRKEIYRWDNRGHVIRIEYDALRRPIRHWVLGTDPANSDSRTLPANGAPAGGVLFERTVYGETHPDSNPSPAGAPATLTLNLRGKVYLQLDMAGAVTNSAYDFKGNLLSSYRQVLSNYQALQDWSGLEPQLAAMPLNPGNITTYLTPPLTGADKFTTSTTYDALNRRVTLTTPDGSVTTPTYDQARLLQTVNVVLPGAGSSTAFVKDIEYNAKGQRLSIAYGNGANSAYTYDPATFRLIRLYTTRPAGINDMGATLFNDPTIIQDLNYTFDPMGNITRLWDHSLKTIFYNNAQVQPLSDYTYDPIYRLITAIGREQIAQAAFAPTLPAADLRDYPFMGLSVNPNDLQALETYTETYVYDPVGNFQTLNHNATNVNWQRSYQYNAATPTNNRLLSSTANAITEKYTYDLDGNISAMAQLSAMGWDFKDELIMTQQQVVNNGSAPGTYYVYDSGGQRVRKVNQNAAGTIVNERIYLGTYEIYQEYANGPAAPSLERQTLHVMDDKDRVALVETAAGNAAAEAAGADIQNAPPFYRYQLTNHLSSALLELDATATILTFEEYYPYGCSSFQAVQNQNQTPKRYRYTGKERDEENGLYYHGARYYAPWLGRWVSCDPAGFVDGPNLYFYVGNNPTHFIDQDGMQEKPPEPDKEDNGSVFSGWAKQNRNTALAQVNEQSADAALLLRALSKIPGLGSLEKAAERIESANAEAQKQAEPISGPKETAGALLSIGLQTIVETKTHLDAMNQTGGTNEEGGEIPPVTPPAGKEVTPPPANGNSIPAANRIAQNAQKGAANDTMAQFSLEHADPIFQGSTNQKFSLKDASGKTLTTGPGRTGSRFPDIQVPAGDNAKSGIELKALSDPTIDPAKVAATSNQLAKEQKFMSNGPVFSGPKDKMWDYVSDEGGTGLTTGMWYWFPPKGQQ